MTLSRWATGAALIALTLGAIPAQAAPDDNDGQARGRAERFQGNSQTATVQGRPAAIERAQREQQARREAPPQAPPQQIAQRGPDRGGDRGGNGGWQGGRGQQQQQPQQPPRAPERGNQPGQWQGRPTPPRQPAQAQRPPQQRDDRNGANRNDNRWGGGERDRNRPDANRPNDNRPNDNRWDGRDNRNDNRWTDNRDRNDNRYQDNRNWNDRNGNDNRQWDRRWRDNNRYDWQRYRSSNRVVFHLGVYTSPYRGYSYRRLGIGSVIQSLFFGSRYWIDDPWQYRLPDAYGPYRWVRYYDDVVLVNIYTGQVIDVIYGFFW